MNAIYIAADFPALTVVLCLLAAGGAALASYVGGKELAKMDHSEDHSDHPPGDEHGR